MYTDLQSVASPLGHSTEVDASGGLRADDGTRTRDPHLGKVMRYQLRYVRLPQLFGDCVPSVWCEENSIRLGKGVSNGGLVGVFAQVRSLEIKWVSASSTLTHMCSLPGTTTS